MMSKKCVMVLGLFLVCLMSKDVFAVAMAKTDLQLAINFATRSSSDIEVALFDAGDEVYIDEVLGDGINSFDTFLGLNFADELNIQDNEGINISSSLTSEAFNPVSGADLAYDSYAWFDIFNHSNEVQTISFCLSYALSGDTLIDDYDNETAYSFAFISVEAFDFEDLLNPLLSVSEAVEALDGTKNDIPLDSHFYTLELQPGKLYTLDIETGIDFNVVGVVPEPCTVVLLSAGLGLFARRRKA